MAKKKSEKETSPTQIEFQAEIQKVLDILIHSLYTEREIFLRELLSNALDALHRIQFEMLTNRNVLDEGAELAVYLETDEAHRTLTIRDTGIGMTQAEMVENLGTIARSGAQQFLQAIQKADEKGQTITADIIGQFGVGFYSVFMVAEEVTVASRSYRPEAEAAVWQSGGQGTYTVGPANKPDRGTTITIKLKEDAKEFAQPYRVRQIVKTHSDFGAFPIYLKEEKPPAEGKEDKDEGKTEFVQVNQQTALWRESPREVEEEKYKSFYQQLTLDFGDPLLRLHTSADAPVQFYALLFVSSKRDYRIFGIKEDYGIKLYSRKILIRENFKELLPKYLRFIEGVVDSEDLPLNVSRETVQTTPLLAKIKSVLVRRIASELEKLAEDKPETYRTFWREFGGFIKEGIATEPDSHDKFVDLLRFQSSQGTGKDDWMSLAQYAGRMKRDQNEIYYILGDDYDVISRSPHLEYFKKHDIEVLYLTDPMDSFMLVSLNEYQGKSLKNVDDAGLDLPAEEKTEETEPEATIPTGLFEALVSRFREVLGERVTDVRESKILTDSPCRLVNPPGAMNTGMQRVQRLLDKDYQIPKKILEINRHSGLIQNISARLAANTEDELINPLIEQLFESALVEEGIHPNPAEMIPRIQQLMEAAAKMQGM
ncbi:MAG: molecular chaperone HtpG [Anaerolineae bacterium]|nr:molecular chaperone HtpG [Anaerolineae bacterium]